MKICRACRREDCHECAGRFSGDPNSCFHDCLAPPDQPGLFPVNELLSVERPRRQDPDCT